MSYSSSFTVLYDANVLYSAPLRDLFMRLAMTGLFRAKWTEDIHNEWMRNLLAKRPELNPKALTRVRELMDENVLDAVITGYQALIPAIEGLPGPNDRHVLAAAIVGRCHVIVTYNLKDFPRQVLDSYGIEAQHPDEFVRHLLDLNQRSVCEAVKKQRASLKIPPQSVEQFLDTLAKQELPLTVNRLRELSLFL